MGGFILLIDLSLSFLISGCLASSIAKDPCLHFDITWTKSVLLGLEPSLLFFKKLRVCAKLIELLHTQSAPNDHEGSNPFQYADLRAELLWLPIQDYPANLPSQSLSPKVNNRDLTSKI